MPIAACKALGSGVVAILLQKFSVQGDQASLFFGLHKTAKSKRRGKVVGCMCVITCILLLYLNFDFGLGLDFGGGGGNWGMGGYSGP